MKKLLLFFIFILFSLATKVQAQTIKVSALDSFSSEHPTSVFRVKTIENTTIQGNFFKSDTIISGIVLRVHEPTRGKRDGYFEFVPTSIYYKGKDTKICMPKTVAEIMYYKPIDPPKAALDVSLKVVNILLKGLVSAVEFTQGAMQAQDGHRIKTGAVKVYKDSFLSYIEVGKELNVRPGDIIVFKLKKIRG